jgi:hypothetical protein
VRTCNARSRELECTGIRSLAASPAFKTRGTARRRCSFLPRTKRKLHGEKRRAGKRGGERRRAGEKKDPARFPLEFTWLENKGSEVGEQREFVERFPARRFDHWIFHGTPVSWKIEISFSAAAESVGVNREGSRNKRWLIKREREQARVYPTCSPFKNSAIAPRRNPVGENARERAAKGARGVNRKTYPRSCRVCSSLCMSKAEPRLGARWSR